VILADDAVLVREGLARLLTEQGFDIVAQVGDADQLIARVAELRPDLAIIDIRMPPNHTTDGLLAAQEIRRHHPHTATLILSQYVDPDYALKLTTKPGHVGYLLKDRIVDIHTFAESLRCIAAGETIIEPMLVDELMHQRHTHDPLAQLSTRERDVLALMAQGRTDRGIADELFVTRKTVEAHVRNILRKLDLPHDASENRRVHAVLRYLRSNTHAATAEPERLPEKR
jgi:serine/threonine-protein kinase PknK